MRYVINRKKNEEKIYAMSLTCEKCMNEDGIVAPKEYCEDCPDYCKSSHNYKEIYSGKIGMSFLEFISLDFDIIKLKILAIYYANEESGIYDVLDAVRAYLKTLPYYIQLLNIPESLYHHFDMKDKLPDMNLESTIDVHFRELITIQKIVSLYAEDKYFVDPYILLQAMTEYHIMFCPSTYVPSSEDYYYEFTQDPKAALLAFAEECKKRRNDVSDFAIFHHMFGISFDWIVSNGYRISICENCGKFFVPYGRYDAKYCPYPYKNGKSCRELSFEINIDNNSVLKEYRKIYKTKHAWMNRNKANHPNAEAAFAKWHKSAKAMVDKYKLGAVSEMECLKWLEDNK